MQIVSVDLESGALRSFNLDLHRDWPVDTPAQTVRLNVVREAYATSLNGVDKRMTDSCLMPVPIRGEP